MTPTSRDALIDTGERLFAEHGINGVSLRQISAEAGHRNTGAVRYHFGDREGLVRAIFESRLPRVNAYRRRLLDELDEKDALSSAVVGAFVRPLASELQYGRYVGFLNRLNHYTRRSHPMAMINPALRAATDESLIRMAELVPESHPGARARRVGLVTEFLISTLDNEQVRRDEAGLPTTASALSPYVDELVSLSVAILETSLSDPGFGRESSRRLRSPKITMTLSSSTPKGS
jgi:AcrR family transcriptional regulator